MVGALSPADAAAEEEENGGNEESHGCSPGKAKGIAA
jgi:hypothetical protein